METLNPKTLDNKVLSGSESARGTRVLLAITDPFCIAFIRGQAKYLIRHGCEVFVISPDGPQIADYEMDEGCRVIRIPFSREISIFEDIKSLFRVIGALRELKPDIINAGTPKAGLLCMIAASILGIKSRIFTLRGVRSDTLTGFKGWLVRQTEALSCTLSKVVIVISPSLREHVVKQGIVSRNKTIVIGKGSSNGIDLNRFSETPELFRKAEELKKQIGIISNQIVIGYVGRVTRDKGVVELFRAFQKSLKSFSNIRLVLTGPIEEDDPIPKHVLHEIKSHPQVTLLGNRTDMPLVYAMYDISVLFSYREGFGNAALEASAMSNPVIVSDIPGARDTVEHMKSGILVEKGNVDKLAKAIEFYVSNEETRNQHGEYGRQRVVKFFSSESIWGGQLALYRKILEVN